MMVEFAYLHTRLDVDPRDLAVLASWLPVEQMTPDELMIELTDTLDVDCARTVPEVWIGASSEQARAERRLSRTQTHDYRPE